MAAKKAELELTKGTEKLVLECAVLNELSGKLEDFLNERKEILKTHGESRHAYDKLEIKVSPRKGRTTFNPVKAKEVLLENEVKLSPFTTYKITPRKPLTAAQKEKLEELLNFEPILTITEDNISQANLTEDQLNQCYDKAADGLSVYMPKGISSEELLAIYHNSKSDVIEKALTYEAPVTEKKKK